MFAIVVPFGKSFDDIWFTYIVPKNLISEIKKGLIVLIPFKNEIIPWAIIDLKDSTEVDINSLKNIDSILYDREIISENNTQLIKYISKKYFTPIHNALWLFVPKNLLSKIIKQKYDINKFNTYNYKNIDIKLSEKQQEIYENIISSEEKRFLLYGVTWSWKTEIYIKLVENYIKKWEQVLLLIPEIILTNQISSRFKDIFWEDIVVINSTITDTSKTNYFTDIYNSSAKIIISTRSGIFYPYNNLWLIIVDEEHDNSYISDNSPRYNTIDIVNEITNLNNNKLLLASGTPSIKSMYDWMNKKYKVLNLLEKYKK